MAGEQFSRSPEIFDLARKKLGDKIEHFGYLENRRAYFDLLRRGDIVISTAFQENFGLSIVEAIAAGCLPLLPERLSYPELIPEAYQSLCLYRNDGELKKRLGELLTGTATVPGGPQGLAEAMSVYHWPKLIPGYDALFQEVVRIP